MLSLQLYKYIFRLRHQNIVYTYKFKIDLIYIYIYFLNSDLYNHFYVDKNFLLTDFLIVFSCINGNIGSMWTFFSIAFF